MDWVEFSTSAIEDGASAWDVSTVFLAAGSKHRETAHRKVRQPLKESTCLEQSKVHWVAWITCFNAFLGILGILYEYLKEGVLFSKSTNTLPIMTELGGVCIIRAGSVILRGTNWVSAKPRISYCFYLYILWLLLSIAIALLKKK